MSFLIQTAYAASDLATKIKEGLINPFLQFLFLIAFFMFIWGVVEFVWHADNPAAREKGKNHIIWGLVGFVIMLGVWGIIGIIYDLVTSFGT